MELANHLELKESNMRNSIFLILVILLVSSCATTAGYEKIVNTAIGKHVDNLVSAWGPPQSTFELSSGGKVFEYIHERNMQVGGHTYSTPQITYNSGFVTAYGAGGSTFGNYSGSSTTYVQNRAPIYNIHLFCKTRFIANAEGIITKWNSEGNDCKA